MRLGYNTNGLAHHRLLDAIDLLADEGYSSVAITLDAGALDPYEEPGTWPGRCRGALMPSTDGDWQGRRDGCAVSAQPAAQARPDPDGPGSRVAAAMPGRLPPPGHRHGVARWTPRRLVLVGPDRRRDRARTRRMDRLAEALQPSCTMPNGRHAAGLRARTRHVHRHASTASPARSAQSAIRSST